MTIQLILLSLLLAQQPAPLGSGTISGQLLDSSGAPTAGVRIGVTPVDGDPAITMLSNLSQTDNQGRYRLEGVPPGRYLIMAGSLSFPSYFPGVADRGEGRTVTIVAGQNITNMDFKLQAGVNATVRTSLLPAQPAGIQVSVDIKVDDGSAPPRLEFDINGARVPVGGGAASRVPNFRAGTNFVVVTKVQLGYYLKSMTYGNADLTRNRLVLPDNPTGAPIEVILTKKAPAGAAPGLNVSGRVTNLNLPSSSDIRLQLTELSPNGAPVLFGRGGVANSMDVLANRKDGVFAIRDLLPGRYTLEFISCFAIQASFCGSGVTFEVAQSDVTNLELKVDSIPNARPGRGRPPVRLTPNSITHMIGTVQVTGGTVPVFELGFTAMRGTIVTHAMTVSDREFSLQLPEGEFRANVSGLPQGYVMESITGGPLDLTEPFLVTKGGITDRMTGSALNARITVRLKAAPPSEK